MTRRAALLTAVLSALSLCISEAGCKYAMSAQDKGDLLLAERLNAAVIARHDGGMPAADRALAGGAYCAVDGVLWRNAAPILDAGMKCR